MKFSLLILLVCIASGCTTQPLSASAERQLSRQEIRRAALDKIDVMACLESGGVVKSVCMFGMPACVHQFWDAGKTCSDSTQCHGSCRIEGEFVPAGSEIKGVCSQDDNPCGCFQMVEQGIAQAAICAD